MKFRRIIDRYLSIFIGGILSVFYLLVLQKDSMPNSLDNIFLGGITISTGLAGFLIASMAIIFSLEEKYMIKQLRRANLYNKLVGCFISAIRWNLASLVIGLFGLFIDFEIFHKWHNYFFSFWIFLITTSICTCYRVIDVLFKSLTANNNHN